MKKDLACALVLAAFAGTAYAGMPAGTGVSGSLHDMNVYINTAGLGGAYSDSMGRVCVFCHTPHNANMSTGGDNYPLWNHDVSAANNYLPYQWATQLNQGLNQGNGLGAQFAIQASQVVIGPTRLCLSCHDGTVAVDQHSGALFGGSNGIQSGKTFISPRANIGTDLTDDHPIGFDYNALRTYRENHSLGGKDADGNREIVNSASTFATAITTTLDAAANQGTYNIINRQAAGGRQIKDVLYQGQFMTCVTCHEVHNKDNATQENIIDVSNQNGGPTVNTAKAPNYFLYAKEKYSAICLSCHVK